MSLHSKPECSHPILAATGTFFACLPTPSIFINQELTMTTIKFFAASMAAASLALCAASPAFAATNVDTDWAAHDATIYGETSFALKAGSGKFTDTFSFTLSQSSDLLATLASGQFDSSKGNFSGQLRLFSGLFDDGLSDSQIGSTFSFNKNKALLEDISFTGLQAGSYYYEVQGELRKVGGNKYYTLHSVALANGGTPPVPEPETYAMLLAGLGVVGIAARRRVK